MCSFTDYQPPFDTEEQKIEKKCACDEILRLIKRAAEKVSEEKGYGKDFVIDGNDLKKFLEELRVEHAGERELDTHTIQSVERVINASTKVLEVPRTNKLTMQENAYTGELIKGMKTMQDRVVLPKGVKVACQKSLKDQYRVLLVKVDKDYKFRVYLGHPLIELVHCSVWCNTNCK